MRDHAPAGRRQRKTGERRVRVPRGTRALPTLDARRAPGERPLRRTRFHLPGPPALAPPAPARLSRRLQPPQTTEHRPLGRRSITGDGARRKGPRRVVRGGRRRAHRSRAPPRTRARVASRARGEAAVPLPLRRGWAGAFGHPGGCRGCRRLRRLRRLRRPRPRARASDASRARGYSPPAAASQVLRPDWRASAARSRARRRRRDGVLRGPRAAAGG